MFSGVPGGNLVLSWRLLGVSQGSLGRVRERPGCVFLVSSCILLQLLAFFSDILAYPGEIVFFDYIRS